MDNTTTLNPLIDNYFVQAMKEEDIRHVARIERTSNETFWVEEDFVRVLDEPGTQGRVITKDGTIIGHFIFQFNENEIQLLNLTILPEYRRQKIGSRVIETLSGRLEKTLVCNVRESNLYAHLFLKYNGLKAQSIVRRYFVDYDVLERPAYEDAYLFSLCNQKSNLTELQDCITEV
jgi:ribosomal-protein-alanine N-acetyltransferase